MKWGTEKFGDIRTRRAFAWLPTEMFDESGPTSTVVWLESYEIREEYVAKARVLYDGEWRPGWRPVALYHLLRSPM